MPVPGPRIQRGPLPGYRNPDRERPADATQFNHWRYPGPIWWPGRTPGLMITSLRGNVLAPGQIRRFWRQTVDMVAAQSSYSWTRLAPSPDRLIRSPGGVDITRALRYMTRSVYARAGTDNTRFDAMHTIVKNNQVHRVVTIGAGQKRNQPTIRNRISSFGSRVPTLNQQITAADNQPPSGATQA